MALGQPVFTTQQARFSEYCVNLTQKAPSQSLACAEAHDLPRRPSAKPRARTSVLRLGRSSEVIVRRLWRVSRTCASGFMYLEMFFSSNGVAIDAFFKRRRTHPLLVAENIRQWPQSSPVYGGRRCRKFFPNFFARFRSGFTTIMICHAKGLLPFRPSRSHPKLLCPILCPLPVGNSRSRYALAESCTREKAR